ncbi:MAG: NAD(P)/FAD-dependent oxidoreductase [Terriglobia bacterium]
MIDLAIIGGGPAGTSAALEALRRGLTVVIFERERFPRDKVCGEFISAESLPLLKSAIPRGLNDGARIRAAEFVSQRGRGLAFPLPQPCLGLSRRVLDWALWTHAVSLGAAAMDSMAARKVSQIASGRQATWEIETDDGEKHCARALLVACGRWWKLEGLASPADAAHRNSAGEWLGAKAHFRGVAPRDIVEIYFFPGGYCGLAPIEGGLYNACCLVHRSLSRQAGGSAATDFASWLQEIAKNAALMNRLKGSTQTGPTVTTAPVQPARRKPVQQGAVLAGDAAGFLDPFTGDGISMALHGGRLAAGEVARMLADNSESATDQEWNRYGKRLAACVRRSYLAAGLLRALVKAPSGVQELAAAAMPAWLGSHLLHETRWHDENIAID